MQREEKLSKTIEHHSSSLFNVEKCSNERAFAETAVNYLRMATEGLIRLTLSMSTIATLWQQVHLCCNDLAENPIQKCVKGAMNYEREKRLKLWTSQPFKRQAVLNYAHWVAFKLFCQDGAETMKKSSKRLMDYAVDTPSYEKARDRMTDKRVTNELTSNITNTLKKIKMDE